MNFKFTKLKTLISAFISAIIGLYFFITEPGLILDGTTSFTQMLMNKFIFFVFWFVLTFIPVYIIWSLFEKKNNESPANIVGIIIGIIIGLLILLAIIFYFAMKFS